MSKDVLINCEKVGKKFCRSLKRSLYYGLADLLSDISFLDRGCGEDSNRPELRTGEFWAVNELSMKLREGDCLGLMGFNGAGKTTLLKMLNGLLKPDCGRIEIRGRIGALIALGAGFNPILTGRENVIVNGSILGMTRKEIDGQMDEIIDFSEIGDAIDAPVRTYSSGMNSRLGFAVATTFKPDVLLVDEVLAVGDFSFRGKALERIEKTMQSACVVLVSHSVQNIIRTCSSVCVMDKGKVRFQGDVGEGVKVYEELGRSAKEGDLDAGYRIAAHESISEVRFHAEPIDINTGDPLTVTVTFHSTQRHEGVTYGTAFETMGTNLVAEWSSKAKGLTATIEPGENRLILPVESLRLSSGHYKLRFGCLNPRGVPLIRAYEIATINVEGPLTSIPVQL